MEFRDIGRAIRRNIVLLLVVIAAALGAATAYSLIVPPTYEATTRVLYSVSSTGGMSDIVAGNAYLTQRIQALVPLAETPLILQPPIDELGLDATSDEIAQFVTVAVEGVGTTVSVIAQSTNPQAAVDLSGAVADSFSAQVTQFETDAVSTTTLRADVVQPPLLPTSPATPNLLLNLGIGLAVGLVVAAALVAIRTATDPRIRDARDIVTATDGLPVLGGIPSSRKPRLDMLSAPASTAAEAYRKLRTQLAHRIDSTPGVSVLVTSPAVHEGKSTVAINLALALAESGEQVTLIDADLRGSTLAERLDLRSTPGFADVVRGTVPVDDAMQSWGTTGIRVLVAGGIAHNASELLGSPVTQNLIGSLATRGGVVVLDAPAALPYADAAVLADSARVVLVVARRGRTRKRDLARTIAAVSAADSTIAGVVLTEAPRDALDG